MTCFSLLAAPFKEIHLDLLKTRDGQEFKNVTINGHNANFAFFFFTGGGKQVALTNLSDEIQKYCGYDSEKAKSEIDKKAAQKEAYDKAVQAQARAKWEKEIKDNYRYVDGKLIKLSEFEVLKGEIHQVLSGGILLSLYDHIYHRGYSSGLGSVGAYSGGGGGYSEEVVGDKTAYVKCDTSGLVDNSKWSGFVYKSGVYSFNSTRGGRETISKYDEGTSYSPALVKPPQPVAKTTKKHKKQSVEFGSTTGQ